MHIKKHTSSLLELIRYANKDKSLELEAKLKSNKNNILTSEVFFNVMKRLKGIPSLQLLQESTELDIGLRGDYENMRVTIRGDQYIMEYCKKNNINLINPAAVSYMKKTRIRHTDINEYNLRFNLKREDPMNMRDSDVSDVIKTWTNQDKNFRYKKRFSFKTIDGMFRFDLTTVKTSQKKIVKAKNTQRKKKDIKPYMMKYVVKPPYVVDVKSWLDKQKDNSLIEMTGRSYPEMMYFKSLQKSNVLKNELEYEIEIEYLGNQLPGKPMQERNVLGIYLQHVMIILQAVQKSYYIISEIEKSTVIDEYKELMKDYKFNAPMNVSLTTQEVIEKNYEEYESSTSIRKGYSVTEKADGERNLLIVLKNGEMYLFNRKNAVKKLGCKSANMKSSIFDCEYIVKDKYGSNINMLLIFDAYFVNGEDIRDRILNRTEEEKQKGVIEKSRYEYIMEHESNFNSLDKPSSNNILISRKRFYFGDDHGVDQETLKSINDIKHELSLLDLDSSEYKENYKELSRLKADSKIFKEAAKVYNKDYPYHIDGLVFTPRSLTVGEEPNVDKDSRSRTNGRWFSCFKWKPPTENTIDFLGVYKREDGTSNYETKYVTIRGNVIECRIMVLHVGYNPVQHTKHNSFKVLNENVTFDPGYNPTPFAPTEPYIKDTHICYLPIEGGECFAHDKNIISDNSIVEFAYNPNLEAGFCWKPLRIRDSFKPNDFTTANNVWKSIFDPVTNDMVLNGNAAMKSNKYYVNIKPKKSERRPMNDFHSYIKKTMLKDNLGGQKRLLDIGVGKGGDINHWVNAGCQMVVGLESVKDNLDNQHNGACNRLLSKYKSNDNDTDIMDKNSLKAMLDNTLMIWADCSKNILNAEAGKDDLSKYYLQLLYNIISKSSVKNAKLKNFHGLGNEFDLVVSNFAIHYFFENSITLNNVARNISSSLKSGSKFMATTLNGEKVFNALRYTNSISNDNDNDSDNIDWKITKKYNEEIFHQNEKGLGMRVEVYVESIGQSLDEFLVHPDYFEQVMSNYGMKLVETIHFEDIFMKQIESNNSYGKMLSMEESAKTYSFMNVAMVFEKE